MNQEKFLFPNNQVISHSSFWEAPSNIALIKYWGKKGNQIPSNPSISFLLSKCFTRTKIKFSPINSEKDPWFTFKLNGKIKLDFYKKIEIFLDRILPYMPSLKNHNLIIDSSNSFPHSSGIASSASSMAAMALCITDWERQINIKMTEEMFKIKSSFLARLGSGSASRSIYGPISSWGKTSHLKESSDIYAVPLKQKVHKTYDGFCNSIIIIDEAEKEISSTEGHRLMNEHPFAKKRFYQANQNFLEIKNSLLTGDIQKFIQIVESEALTLHALMMTSSPSYKLFKPETIKIIELIKNYRENSKNPLCFTLDAGPNIHLLYPKAYRKDVLDFIDNELIKTFPSIKFIHDQVGNGPKKI